MKITSGRLLVATGAIHCLIGIAVGLGATGELGGRNLFADVGHDGVVNAIAPDPTRMAMFWFLFFGFAVVVLGDVIHVFERRGLTLPASLGWQLGALGLAGALMIPASGFWLVLPQAWWIVHRSSTAAVPAQIRTRRTS
jgi:hypothetical protein